MEDTALSCQAHRDIRFECLVMGAWAKHPRVVEMFV